MPCFGHMGVVFTGTFATFELQEMNAMSAVARENKQQQNFKAANATSTFSGGRSAKGSAVQRKLQEDIQASRHHQLNSRWQSIADTSPFIGQPVVQGVFNWSDTKDDVDKHDNNQYVSKVFPPKGVYKTFLNYLAGKYGVLQKQAETDIVNAYNDETEHSLGAQSEFKNLAEAIENWLVKQKGYTEQEQEEKRGQYNPKPLKGKSENKGRITFDLREEKKPERKGSFSEGMKHLPMFSFGGSNTTTYTTINDNSTYSIGMYELNDEKHFIGGSISGESFEKEKQMHAEEQQMAAFRMQVEKNVYGLKDTIEKGTVILHMHISKTPCMERCQNLIAGLLNDYKNLEIQLHVEVLYKSNDVSEMKKEATAFNLLLKKYTGRLSYQTVSTLDPYNSFDESVWGKEKVETMLSLLKEKDFNPEKAELRKGNFEKMQKDGILQNPDYTSGIKSKLKGEKKVIDKSEDNIIDDFLIFKDEEKKELEKEFIIKDLNTEKKYDLIEEKEKKENEILIKEFNEEENKEEEIIFEKIEDKKSDLVKRKNLDKKKDPNPFKKNKKEAKNEDKKEKNFIDEN